MQSEHPAEEIKRLRRCINDLVSLFALPAVWSGGDPSQIARTLLDVLLGMLGLDIVYARLKDPVRETPIEMVRIAQSQKLTAQPQEIGEVLNHWLGPDPQKWAPLVRNRLGDGDISIVPLRLGLQGEIGVVIAGSRREDFPQQTERLLLGVAANLAAIGLQEALLLSEQRRIADILDHRVAQRTEELATANDGLKREIAERERAEKQLRESEFKLRQLTETIPEMLWSATPEGAVDYCNARVLDYTGFSADEIMGSGWTKILHPDDVDQTVRTWTSCVASGVPYRVEVRIFHAADRTYRWCVTSALPLLDEQGNILKWHGTVVDMHDWKEAQEELRNMQAELAHMTRVMTMGELTASIAHEVNQPLAAIITNSETGLRWLARPELDVEKVRELTKRVVTDARRASEIIDGIRAMATRKVPEPTPLSLGEIVEESMAFLRHEFQSRSISVSLDLAPALPRVVGDRTQLQQVIVNVTVNAVQAVVQSEAMPRKIFVRTMLSDPETVCCTIEDSGPGIEPTHLPRLFDSFFTTKDAGMGMGLPICRAIIEAHDGHISADNNSALGGARFSFSLPANSAGQAAPHLSN